MGERPAVEVEVKHYSGVLRHAIRAAGFSVSEVERRLGAGPKSLRRVLGGQVDLKFKHVVAVLRIIGMSQEHFFAIAARRRRQRPPGLDTREAGGERTDPGERTDRADLADLADLRHPGGLADRGHPGNRAERAPLGERGERAAAGEDAEPAAGLARTPGDPASEEEFDRLVEEAVNRVIARRARDAGLAAEQAAPPGDQAAPAGAAPDETAPEGAAPDAAELAAAAPDETELAAAAPDETEPPPPPCSGLDRRP